MAASRWQTRQLAATCSHPGVVQSIAIAACFGSSVTAAGLFVQNFGCVTGGDDEEEVLFVSAGGLVSRNLVSSITIQSRTAKGIAMLNLQVPRPGAVRSEYLHTVLL